MELPGKRKRGRPTRRFMDVVSEDMVGVTEQDAEEMETDVLLWRPLTGAAGRTNIRRASEEP